MELLMGHKQRKWIKNLVQLIAIEFVLDVKKYLLLEGRVQIPV